MSWFLLSATMPSTEDGPSLARAQSQTFEKASGEKPQGHGLADGVLFLESLLSPKPLHKQQQHK